MAPSIEQLGANAEGQQKAKLHNLLPNSCAAIAPGGLLGIQLPRRSNLGPDTGMPALGEAETDEQDQNT